MGLLHTYTADVVWTGAGATGTRGYTSYSRDHEVRLAGKPPLLGSSDPAFRGDPNRYNPEELLVGALAQCHMLWFLHVAAADGVVVVGYSDRATGTMRISGAGHGRFTEVVLRPWVTLAPPEPGAPPVSEDRLRGLHERAHQHCFIARSVNFPIHLDPAPLHDTEAGPDPGPDPRRTPEQVR